MPGTEVRMKNAAVIGIGTELLKGKIDDTNATYLSGWLSERGIRVVWRCNVPDSRKLIAAAFRSAAACDLIVATGGLGPTEDDLTREALAAYLGKELVFDEGVWQGIKAFFEKHFKAVPESNRRQAYTIPGAAVLENLHGTAPGLWYGADNKYFALLPGPPRENQPMIETGLRDRLRRNGLLEGTLSRQVLRCYHIGESALADLLKEAGFRSEVGYYFSQSGYVELHFNRFSADQAEGDRLVKEDAEKAGLILDARAVFHTPDADLSRILLDELKKRPLTIAFAESVTGGALAADLVRHPGASQVLCGGVVVYSNDMKERLLDVSPETIRESGAVSAETVREMAWGLRQTTGADVCVSVSGIAGPDGGSEDKPVGLVHFGFLIRDKYFHREEKFPGDRERVIKRVMVFAFAEVLKAIAAEKPEMRK
jgi:nicotinamide-nucleotide amidase